MAYYDAISNAIAARGNALAQAAQQQGQVYGNLASNLGQLPFQAMQAGQRRRALEVETQQRAAQTQTIQNELDFQKEAYATMSRKDLSPEQLDVEMGNILKKFGKFQEFEALQSRKMQTAVNKYNVLKGGPGTPPPGGFALPEPTQGVTQPGMGVANAFAPVVPAAQQMVNPEVDIPGIGPLRPPTAGDIDFQKQQADRAASAVDLQRQQQLQRSGIEGQKEVALYGSTLRPPVQPPTSGDTDVRMENGVPVTYQFNKDTQRFDIRVGQARPLQMPPASAAITTEDVDYWKQMIETGQAKLTDVPVMQRGKVNKALAQGGNLNIPPKIREQVNGVDRAIGLLAPVKELVEKIIAGEDVITNSALLENYTNSVGTLLSRSLGERGVATEGDVKRATGLVAGWKAANFAPEFARREMALLEGILGSQKKALTTDYFKAVPSGGGPAAPTSGGGLDPQKKARLEELRRKKAAGTLGR